MYPSLVPVGGMTHFLVAIEGMRALMVFSEKIWQCGGIWGKTMVNSVKDGERVFREIDNFPKKRQKIKNPKMCLHV